MVDTANAKLRWNWATTGRLEVIWNEIAGNEDVEKNTLKSERDVKTKWMKK